MAKKVFLGVGHGGIDAGAVGNGFREADLNLSIALACAEVLKKYGVSVKMSRTKNENDDLNEEIRECNAYNPDLAVDIHNNAGGGDGAEVFYSLSGGKSKTLAQNILNEIVKIGQNSRGIKTKRGSNGDWFGFIRCTNAPAVLIECAFVDTKDIQIIDTLAEQKAMGEAVAKGILATLGIKAETHKNNVQSKPTTTKKTPTKKTVDELAKEVISGKWGNGQDRKTRLTKAGYNYSKVQAKVDELMGKTKKKSITEIAKEVIAGKWGNGADRKNRLTKAGYNYNEVQKQVNKLM